MRNCQTQLTTDYLLPELHTTYSTTTCYYLLFATCYLLLTTYYLLLTTYYLLFTINYLLLTQAAVEQAERDANEAKVTTLKTYDPGYEGRYAYNPRTQKSS